VGGGVAGGAIAAGGARAGARRWGYSGRGGTFGLGDGVDGQAHEGLLKLGSGEGSGMRGEFEDAASEREEFDRGSVSGGRVLKLGLKGSEPSRQSIAL
jgi:hypothetical protein